jgi:protein-tyrosine phosphatase
MNKTSVLFVCLGNICRSPAAEGVFVDLISKANLRDNFIVDSAGTSGAHAGEKADGRMRSHALKRGIELTSLSRQFVYGDFAKFDYIIVMDDSNYQNVLRLDPIGEYAHKLYRMRDYLSSKYQSFKEIPDPYYGGSEGFELVLNLLEDGCRHLLNQLSK